MAPAMTWALAGVSFCVFGPAGSLQPFPSDGSRSSALEVVEHFTTSLVNFARKSFLDGILTRIPVQAVFLIKTKHL